jgi:hypothetical protein
MRNSNVKEEQGAIKAPFLDRIYSTKKQTEIFGILQAIHPTHSERLWLSGFLKYVGYSYEEAFSIISEHCDWEDYSPAITAYQLASVYKQSHSTHNTTSQTHRVRKWQLNPTEVYRIQVARSVECHRELTRWMQENNIPVYDAAPDLDFDATKMSMKK